MPLILGFFLFITGFAIQPSGPVRKDTKLPKQVLENYWTMETRGGRLTTAGWSEANAGAVRAASRPSRLHIIVIYGNSSVWDPVIKGKSADVTVGVQRAGEIDAELKYTPIHSENIKEGIVFHLALVEQHGTAAVPSGATEWKLEQPSEVVWLSIPSAIRYLSDQRDSTTSLMLRRNAEESIKTLHALKSE